MSNEMEELQKIAHKWTVIFLEKNLPELHGKNWWEKRVIKNLSDNQEKWVKLYKWSKLEDLDLGTILHIFDSNRNWYDLKDHLNFPPEKRNLLKQLREIRNSISHQNFKGIPLNEQIRFADTISRYLEFIGADASVVQSVEEMHQILITQLVKGMDADEEQENNKDGQTDHTSTTDEISKRDEIVNEELNEDPNDQLPLWNLQTDAPSKSDGVPVGYLGLGESDVQNVRDTLKRATYIGIDFGTSTTVVSLMTANESGELQAEPILIPQFEESGRETDDHILPSCIAWIKEKLLVGHGAEDLKSKLIDGQNIWSSFKMELGIDLGPQYYNTELASGKTPYIIERPQDAANVFFTYLREKVEDYVRTEKLSENIFYSVSVPASFEANQRQDLIRALSNAGILVDESSLIDEPNAGFLSYLFEMEKESHKKRFLDSLAEKKSRIMVFDFGAGTCDISVLEVEVENELLLSKNLAISKFMVLGGDDIDLEIAKKILLPQLVKEEEPTDVFTTIELENVVIPRLKPEAERLKISCCKIIDTQGLNIAKLRENTTPIKGKKIQAITIKKQRWELTTPQITLSEFAKVMDPIINIEDRPQDQAQNVIPNIFEPIHNALDKSGLSKDDLNMVLFIGGSCSNTVVRKAIEDYFGRFIGFYTPRDLRSHVSRGAAIHSLFFHGLDREMIRPITSETIYLITRNEGLEKVIPAGTIVPSPEVFVTEYKIDGDNQQRVELPFCVGGRDKILGKVLVMYPDPKGSFKVGTRVRVSCTITREKLLDVTVVIGQTKLTEKIFNPLANTELIPQHRQLLEARQALNESILKGNGKPELEDVRNYAFTAQKAKLWREAAEMILIIEEYLDRSKNYATHIAYLYAKDGDFQKSDHWSEVAYERSPGCISAYNLAITRKYQGNTDSFEELIEEALNFDDSNAVALECYGHYLMKKTDDSGKEYIVRACDIFSAALLEEELREDDCSRLERAAQTLGKEDILESLRVYRKRFDEEDPIVQPEFLVSSDITTEPDLKQES